MNAYRNARSVGDSRLGAGLVLRMSQLALLSVACLQPSLATAQTIWKAVGNFSMWFSNSNWTEGEPDQYVDAWIPGGAEAQIYDERYWGTASVRDLYLGNGGWGRVYLYDFNDFGPGKLNSRQTFIGVAGLGLAVVRDESVWTNTGDIFVGYQSQGELGIGDGGKLTSNRGFIGDYASGIGKAFVGGSNSTWTNAGELRVGNVGSGEMTVREGGAVSNTTGYLGYHPNGKGTATVDDAGSIWTNSGDLIVGYQSTQLCTLVVEDGGAVVSARGFLGDFAGTNGYAALSGDGSRWNSGSELRVANAGVGTLAVYNGANVSATTAYIGYLPGSQGGATVGNPGATWTVNQDLFVGYQSTQASTLSIITGGVVSSGRGRIGFQAGANGVVSVDGVGSAWNCGAELLVGYLGAGKLIVSNGGRVSATNGVFAYPASTVQGNGTINSNLYCDGAVRPGAAVGTLQVTGEFSLSAPGSLHIELASATSADKLAVGGNVALAGALDVSLVGGFVPSAGQTFDILDWTGSLIGAFGSVTLPSLGGSLAWDTSQLYANGVLSISSGGNGDFDGNGIVGGGDLVNWQGGFGVNGGAGIAQGDADNDDDVDGADFLVWQRKLGGPPFAIAGAAPVPEPVGAGFWGAAGLSALRCLRRRPPRHVPRS